MIKKIFRNGLVIGIIILFLGASVGATISPNINNKDMVKNINPTNEDKPGQIIRAWSDNFDSYATGSPLHGQGGWEAWDDNPATTAYVSDTQSQSTPNSVEIAWFSGNSADIVQQFTGVDSGKWRLIAYQYVPSDMVGSSFYIFMNTYTHGTTHDLEHWSCQIRASASEGIIVDYDNAAASLPLITDQWVLIRVEIDFDADWQEVYYGDDLLLEKSWTSGVSPGGALNLACVDLYADQTTSTSVYYDDMYLGASTMLVCDANGPYEGLVGEDVEFEGMATGGMPPYEFHWEFGDGETSDEQNPTHNYENPGEYTVTLTVTDTESNTADDTTEALINGPPSEPEIDGETNGEVGEEYDYEFTSIDPDDDDIAEYIVNWGDETGEETIAGPFGSGEEADGSHTWTAGGDFIITAKAKDINGLIGPEAQFQVTMPRGRLSARSMFLRILERFPHTFPLLRHILGL